ANFQGGTVLMLRPATLTFLKAAPRLPPTDKPAARLRALVPWLRHADPMVSASARKEFADASYEAMKAAAREVRPDDLLRTLADPEAAPASRSPLFLLVGLSGGAAERKRLGTWMADPLVQRAPGYDALLAAWVTMTGPEGLATIEALFENPKLGRAIVGGAYVRALGFQARNERALTRPQVIAALHRLLAEPACFGVTLEELARLEAWGELDAVVAAYGRHRAKAPWTLGPVLRYLEAHPAARARTVRDRLQAELLEAAPKRPAPKSPAPGK
ncbi:MAG: hypothetical protein P1V36_14995, partial [Planctomycetota bacterium]|nr:hypothetical protein [Planctomycetota bacterium]